jgi:hypothetical protein
MGRLHNRFIDSPGRRLDPLNLIWRFAKIDRLIFGSTALFRRRARIAHHLVGFSQEHSNAFKQQRPEKVDSRRKSFVRE